MTHGEDTPSAANAAAARLTLPYTLANFRLLLAEGARSSSRYTHADIAAWAGAFWWRYTI
jgi:hypothetical protein